MAEAEPSTLSQKTTGKEVKTTPVVWSRRLCNVPDITFGWVESFCKETSKLPKKIQTKGWNFYIGGYIDWENLEVKKEKNGCTIRGTCYRSMKKNEQPHRLRVRT